MSSRDFDTNMRLFNHFDSFISVSSSETFLFSGILIERNGKEAKADVPGGLGVVMIRGRGGETGGQNWTDKSGFGWAGVQAMDGAIIR